LGLEQDALEALSGLAANQGTVDSSQLYLLQAAFRSLESFFNLADSTAASPDAPAAASAAGKALKAGPSAEAQNVAASIAKSTDLRKNEDYVTTEGGPGVKEQSVPILSSGFEFDLAQSLLETQEALRKTRMRMDVLEMVQEEAMMGGNSVNLDNDEEVAMFIADGGNNLHGAFAGEGHEASTAEDPKDRDFTLTRAATEEEIVQEVGAKYDDKHTSFEGIMSELSALRVCLAERASVDNPLGHLLDRNVAVVPLDKGAPGSADGASESGAAEPLPALLKSMTESTKDLLEIVKVKTQASSASQTVLNTVRQQEEKLTEYRGNLEQAEIARNEFTSLTVELQILRERIQRHAKDEGQLNLLTVKNLELTKHVKELEDQLGDSKSRRKEGSESKGDSKKIHELRTLNQQLELQKNAHVAEAERLGKENTRLRAAMAISEQRVKGALQDQMALHHQLQQLEEENMNAKATITKLTREMEDYKVSRGHREDADRRISELQREIHKRDVELAEAREEASQTLKYQNELQAAEKTIEHLEMSVGEMSVELEKGSVAMLQLESYREQLRVKTKENRDMSLHIHGLENQLKDVPYLQTRYQEVQEELEDCKMKIEKLPGLLSEQARLRGSSRASVKALQEHDKTLSHYKNRVKQLERETAVLKNDNRAMQELEAKLKEANQEIKRLLTAIAEGNNAGKPGSAPGAASVPGGAAVLRPAFSAEEDKKKVNTNDGQYRKMRSRIRQSIAMSGVTGTAGMAAAVAATLSNNTTSS
jgi:DNA repair exonuclease SbcCD ATPase subunit